MRSTSRLAAMAAVSLCTPAVALAEQAQTFAVDCAKGQTISAALDKGDSRKPMVLIVQGTCNENVAITRDDVTLQGDATKSALINGPSGLPTITVRASRVTLDRLAVRGGTQGITLMGGSNVDITNSNIQYAASQGIGITGTSAVNVTNCTVQNNTRTGIAVMTQANVSISNSQITNNAGDGVRAFRGSSVSLNGGSVSTNAYAGVNVQSSEMTITGSTIAGNGTNASLPLNVRSGVSGLASNITINNTTVRDNAGAGVGAAGGGYLNVGSSTVTGNNSGGVFLYGANGNILGNTTISGNFSGTDLSLMLNATVQLADGNLTIPNISVSKASILWVNPEFGPPISATVQCADGESSVNFSPRITGYMFCTGF